MFSSSKANIEAVNFKKKKKSEGKRDQEPPSKQSSKQDDCIVIINSSAKLTGGKTLPYETLIFAPIENKCLISGKSKDRIGVWSGNQPILQDLTNKTTDISSQILYAFYNITSCSWDFVTESCLQDHQYFIQNKYG